MIADEDETETQERVHKGAWAGGTKVRKEKAKVRATRAPKDEDVYSCPKPRVFSTAKDSFWSSLL